MHCRLDQSLTLLQSTSFLWLPLKHGHLPNHLVRTIVSIALYTVCKIQTNLSSCTVASFCMLRIATCYGILYFGGDVSKPFYFFFFLKIFTVCFFHYHLVPLTSLPSHHPPLDLLPHKLLSYSPSISLSPFFLLDILKIPNTACHQNFVGFISHHFAGVAKCFAFLTKRATLIFAIQSDVIFIFYLTPLTKGGTVSRSSTWLLL